MFVRDNLIASGDATATAERIMASEFLWRVGVAGEYFLSSMTRRQKHFLCDSVKPPQEFPVGLFDFRKP